MGRDEHHVLAKVAFLVVVVACFISAGYPGWKGTPPDDAGLVAEPLAGTAWRLVELCADNGSIVAPQPQTEPVIIFGESGTLSGSCGCNLYSALYRINGSAISIEPVAITRAYPATAEGLKQQETRYHELLVAAASYQVEGDRLVFSGPSGKVLLVFSRADLPETLPLLGTTWRLTHYSTGGGSAVASPIPGTNVTLVFEDDATLSGSCGCNVYLAPYQVNETGLAVGRVLATKMSCTEPAGVMEQEATYLDLLGAAAGYRIVGDRLAVIDSNGRAILFFVAEP